MVNYLKELTQTLRLKISNILLPVGERKVLQTQVNGYALLVIANEDVGRLIHFLGCYEPGETALIRQITRADSICVDVGANVGYFTILMASVANEGTVHAFEPIPLNAALLRASAELNGLRNVRVNECAVADHHGVVSFSQSTDSAYSSIRDTGRKPSERTFSTSVIALDEYLDRERVRRVDILKVDAEGAEALIVAGASRLLGDDRRKPRLVILELYDQNLQAFGSSVETVIERMGGYGYKPFVVSPQGELLPYVDQFKARYYNVVFTVPEPNAGR